MCLLEQIQYGIQDILLNFGKSYPFLGKVITFIIMLQIAVKYMQSQNVEYCLSKA